jgi:hypothetical protein
MLHTAKTNRLKMPWTYVVCAFLFAAAGALLPTSAPAQCSNWNASGPMKIWQRGQPYPIELTLQQKGVVVSGTAALIVASEGRRIEGPVDGAIEGNSFSIQIFWNDHQTGVYNAKILPSGRLDGEGWEKNTPKVHVTWHSDGFLKCPPPAFSSGGLPTFLGTPPPRKPAPPPLKSSGKARTDPSPPPPYIIAGQPIIPTPAHPFGIVVLAWDGGPDNSDAEVLMSIDNGAVIPAFSMEQAAQSPVWKQSKMASIPLQLQRGHYYKFILKAAGHTLSSAAFVVP